MKMKKCHQEPDRAIKTTSPAGFDRPSKQARELFEDDDEWLAMRQGGKPLPST